MAFNPVPKPPGAPEQGSPTMNYEESGLLETAIGDTEYRIDVGKQGTAMALSTRPTDTWDWSYLCEVKWDGRALSARQLHYDMLKQLSQALREAIEEG
jgi:hypothetical protein